MKDSNLPAVSVVIPCFNYGRFVGSAIESVLAQSHRPLEIIVVDDGSTDDTEQMLRKYLPEIVYLQQENRGVSAARNTGIRAAQAQWVAFLDADDLWLQDKLRLQMQCARLHPDLCLLGALAKSRGRSQRGSDGDLFSFIATQDLLGGLPFGTSSVVARRECLMRAGLFNEDRRYAEDRELWLKLSLSGGAARVNVPLWEYRFHDGQAIANTSKMADAYRRVLDEFFALHQEHQPWRAAAYGYYHYDTAMSYFEGGRSGKALRQLVCSFLARPVPLPLGQAEAYFSRTMLLLKCCLGRSVFQRMRGLLGRRRAA